MALDPFFIDVLVLERRPWGKAALPPFCVNKVQAGGNMNKKQAYEEKIRSQLDEMNAKIDVLKSKAKHAEASAKVEYFETIENLQKKRSEVEDRLQSLRDAGESAWEDMKQGVEESWSTFAASVKSAVSRFQ